MGSICSINRNPNTWRMWYPDKKLKEKFGGESLVKIVYGTFDDYPQSFEMEMYMRESIYQKLISGEYKVSSDSNIYKRLIIEDSNGDEVRAIADDFCY